MSWPLPDNTGAYEIRAYAVSPEHFGGGATAEQRVRKPLTMQVRQLVVSLRSADHSQAPCAFIVHATPITMSLTRPLVTPQASIPRVARVGDRFRCGVTVTASPEIAAGTRVIGTLRHAAASDPTASTQPLPLALLGDAAGPALSSLHDTSVAPATTSLAIDTREFSISPSEIVELVFEIEARGLGEAVLIAEVRQATAGGGADALELRVPVEGLQPAVQVATSRALVASPTPSLWKEGIALPDALAGEGNLTLEVGAGHLPVVQALSTALLSLPAQMVYQRTAPPLLASMAAAAALGPYPRAEAALSAALRQLDLAAAELKSNAPRI